jgi:hypothetical protein
MIVKGLASPPLPAATVIVQETTCDWNELRAAGRSAGQGKHQQSIVVAQEGPGFTVFDPLNIGSDPIKIRDGKSRAKLLDRPHLLQPMIAAEVTCLIEPEQSQQGVLLNFAAVRPSGHGPVKSLSQPTAYSMANKIADGVQKHRTRHSRETKTAG